MISESAVSYHGVRTRELRVAGDGPIVVLLHGFCDSADTWRDVLNEFFQRGRAAVAVDLPGFGAADALLPGAVLPQLDDFVEAVITDHEPVVLMGNSLGACAAVRAACRHRPGIGGVVAVDEPILADNMAIRIARRAKEPWPLRILETQLPVPKQVVGWAVGKAIARVTYARHRDADPEVVDRFVATMPDLKAVAMMVRRAREIALETAGGYDTAALRCPLLVVHGARDRIIPVHASIRLHRAVPGSRLAVLPTCGHCPQLDDPTRLAEMAEDFIESYQMERS